MDPRLRMLAVIMFTVCATSCVRNDLPLTPPSEIETTREAHSPLPWQDPDILLFTANGKLVSLRPDGSGRKELLYTDYYESPSWSLNGQYIAYVSSDAGNGDIFITTWDGLGDPEKSANITQSADFDDGSPCWAPDNRQIAFTSNRQDSWGIFTAELLLHDDDVEPVLLRQRRLTSNLRFDGHPDWSPDGKWIAYMSDRGFRWQIYLSHTSGTWTIPMTGTTHLRSTAYPAWSPDGSQMAFASTFEGSWDIYILQTDGSDLRQLTSHPAQDWHPTWSPDGEWVAFVSNRKGASDLYIISADGQNLIQLTDNDAVEDYPDWNVPSTTLTKVIQIVPSR